MTREQMDRWRWQFRSIAQRKIEELLHRQEHDDRRVHNYEREIERLHEWLEAFQ